LAEYNDRQHATLKRGRQTLTPNQAWEIARDEGWEPTLLNGDDLHDLLPSDARHVSRGEVRLPWGRYFSKDLAPWHERLVSVHYDPADGSRVWVAAGDGHLICEAKRDGNARPYVHESQIEYARDKREDARIRRLERKIATVKAEETPLVEIVDGETYDLPVLHPSAFSPIELAPEIAARVEAGREAVEQIQSEAHYLDKLGADPERYDTLRILRDRDAGGEVLSEREYRFMESFSASTYARMADRMREKFEADCAEQPAP
jgi:hypothetical protein